MTNFEAYSDQLKEFLYNKVGVTKQGSIECCELMDCKDCMFAPISSCVATKRKWLDEEYVEPQVDWTKVAVDTPILVRDHQSKSWNKRHFAKYENEKVFVFDNGRTSWSSNKNDILNWNYAKLAEREERK